MGRNENIEIFKDTEKLVKNNETIKASVKASTNKQKIILEDDTIDLEKKEKKSVPARVIVSQKRTFEAASEYKGMKTVVHNFASATNPGGGVVRGANAQEECLCRCSGLYFNLNEQNMWDGFTDHIVPAESHFIMMISFLHRMFWFSKRIRRSLNYCQRLIGIKLMLSHVQLQI